MTLGEFRKYTALMSDDVELVANLGTLREKINTFNYIEDNTLDLCHSNYGEDDFQGIITAIAFINNKNFKL